jgi:hypothetical protein
MTENPWLTAFFNITAGLEKAIIAIAAAFQVWVGSFPTVSAEHPDGWTEADKALVIALIGVVQIIYATNTEPKPPTDEAPLPPPLR